MKSINTLVLLVICGVVSLPRSHAAGLYNHAARNDYFNNSIVKNMSTYLEQFGKFYPKDIQAALRDVNNKKQLLLKMKGYLEKQARSSDVKDDKDLRRKMATPLLALVYYSAGGDVAFLRQSLIACNTDVFKEVTTSFRAWKEYNGDFVDMIHFRICRKLGVYVYDSLSSDKERKIENCSVELSVLAAMLAAHKKDAVAISRLTQSLPFHFSTKNQAESFLGMSLEEYYKKFIKDMPFQKGYEEILAERAWGFNAK